jgi:hypothetical protein
MNDEQRHAIHRLLLNALHCHTDFIDVFVSEIGALWVKSEYTFFRVAQTCNNFLPGTDFRPEVNRVDFFCTPATYLICQVGEGIQIDVDARA